MIDTSRLDLYRENNRVEAKRALGGLPESLWETYSAFANTSGGVILLGVEELADKSLHATGLPDPRMLVDEFQRCLGDRTVVSANIMTDDRIHVVNVDGADIVAIDVPRASKQQRPVYIGTDPYAGSYKREGEADIRCTREEVSLMLRRSGRQ